MSGKPSSKPVIGWREWIGLPDLGISRIKVKVDTGARSSSVHASEVEFFSRRGVRWVRFSVHPIQRDFHTTVYAEAELLDRRAVRNSGGSSEHRVTILTPMRFLDEEWPIELTLTSRDAMGFRMLLGRQAVRNRFVVDPGRSFVAGRPLRKRKSGRSRVRSAGDGGSA